MFMDLLFLAVGIFLGWVVIPQPAWASTAYTAIKTKISSLFGKK